MRRELLVAFIALVDRQKKCVRIGRMKHDGNVQFGGLVKDRSQPLIVDPQQPSLTVAYPQTQILPELDALRPALDGSLQPRARLRREIWPFDAAPVHPGN